MSRPTKMTLNLDALYGNLQRVKKIAPSSRVLAMVKGNAYGHGIDKVIGALTESNAFGVSSLEEGILLRNLGICKPIVLIQGVFESTELPLAFKHRLTLVVHQAEQISYLEYSKLSKQLFIWLKINTGMNRLGFRPDEVRSVYSRLIAIGLPSTQIGFMTHFASADSLDCSTTLHQIKTFDRAIAGLRGSQSLCNSPGVIAWKEAHRDWVRPGLMLYGISPLNGRIGKEHGLQPVMTLKSKLTAIQSIKKGALVGYGGTWVCPEDMLMGVVGIGHGDGYPQQMKCGTPVLVNDKVCPLVGRVSMDMLTVDLRSAPFAKVGDEVILWGDGLPIELVAKNNVASTYELLNRVKQRVPIEIKEESLLLI